jgi:hypothetical protein
VFQIFADMKIFSIAIACMAVSFASLSQSTEMLQKAKSLVGKMTLEEKSRWWWEWA